MGVCSRRLGDFLPDILPNSGLVDLQKNRTRVSVGKGLSCLLGFVTRRVFSVTTYLPVS